MDTWILLHRLWFSFVMKTLFDILVNKTIWWLLFDLWRKSQVRQDSEESWLCKVCEDKDAARHRQWGWKSEWQQADRVEEWHYQRMYFDFDCVVVSHCLCSSPQWLAEWEITAPRGHDNISLSHCHFVYVDLPTRSLRSPFVRVFRGFFLLLSVFQSLLLSAGQ